jgi:hypothetical protein
METSPEISKVAVAEAFMVVEGETESSALARTAGTAGVCDIGMDAEGPAVTREAPAVPVEQKRVGTSEGDRSESRRGRGVGWGHCTCEAGEVI